MRRKKAARFDDSLHFRTFAFKLIHIHRWGMKPIVAIIVFFSLMLPSLFLGYANYVTAKEHIIEDVNQALVKTVLSSHPERVTADTLRVFKSYLQIGKLKGTSYLSLCTDEPSKVSFCSDTVSFKTADERLYLRAYPTCSRATISYGECSL